MKIVKPSETQVQKMADAFGFVISPSDLVAFTKLIGKTLSDRDGFMSQDSDLPIVKYPRVPGVATTLEDDPLNGWYVKSEIKGAESGPLAGKRIAIKDNICVAGVQMMNGSNILEGYMPEIDATVVTRLLDAGATIAGKSNAEDQCQIGSSFSNVNGHVHNPYKHGYSAGGSSSGTGALVGSGEIEIGLGSDSGGSIRIPASYCGCYGMKATHGLVPCTGAVGMEMTLEHIGPITTTVEDNAKTLEVLAGPDGYDPRQYSPVVHAYTKALNVGVKGLKIGILKEGFGHDRSEEDVDEAVRNAAKLFTDFGAEVTEVSIPHHLNAPSAHGAIFDEGMTELMMKGNAFGSNWRGLYLSSLMTKQATWRNRPNDLPDAAKLSMLIGHYARENYYGTIYGRAQNFGRLVRKAYDKAFKNFDLLLMPTLPMKAQKLPNDDCTREEYFTRAFEMIPNTSPFNLTGHPSMSIPCAIRDGLPIGLMLVGKYYDETTIYSAAAAFEAKTSWKEL